MMIKRICQLMLALLAVTANLSVADQPIRIGTNVWPGYEPLYLARSLQDWQQDGDIVLVEYPSSTEVIRAFRNRAIESAALTLDEALVLRQARIPIQIILVMDVSEGGDVIMARPGIERFEDLQGKRVAVETGALGAYMTIRALEIHAMTLDDIIIEHLDVSAHEQAYKTGQVDAVVTFDPVRTLLKSAGASEIFSSRQMPGEIVDVLVVHQDFLQQHPAVIKTLLQDWFKALEYFRQQPQAAAEIMSKRLGLSPQQVLDSYDGLMLPSLAQNRQMLGGRSPRLQQTINQLGRVMKNNGLLPEWVDIQNLFNAEYLPRR